MKRYFLSVGVNHQVTDFFHVYPVVVVYFHGEVEYPTALVHLGYDSTGECHVDELGEFGQGNAVFGEHIPFRFDL